MNSGGYVTMLSEAVDALDRANQMQGLLEEIWLHLGPYTDALPLELRGRLNDFMQFDDSE